MYSIKSFIQYRLPQIIIFSSVIFVFSCGRHNKPGLSGFADESFAENLSDLLGVPDTNSRKVKIRTVSEELQFVYQADDYQPIWIKENYSANMAADQLIDELEDMQCDGADTSQFKLAELKNLKLKLDTTKHNSVDDAIAFDTALTHYYLQASKFLLLGYVKPRKVDSLWYFVNDTVWTGGETLVSSGGRYPSLNLYRSDLPTYSLLRNECKLFDQLRADSSYLNAKFNMAQCWQHDSILKMSAYYIIQSELPWFVPETNDSISEEKQLIMAYQQYRSIRKSKKLDSTTISMLAKAPEDYIKILRANMERIRWMPQKTTDMYVVVNVPLMELFFVKDGLVTMHKNVVVGKKNRQTPSLFANMTNLVINPPWGVPPTILKNDVLPGIQKSGKEYLVKKGLKIYDKEGKQVSVSAVNSRNYRRYTYKQAPGNDNSLGYVKFNMPNKWDIYLHDTPHREDFGKRDRALSSGCIRVHNPQELALYILGDLEKKEAYTQGRLDTIISTHKTRSVSLKQKIPVFITYLTVYEDSTGRHLQFVRDVYNRDEKLLAKMD
jgi:L,D-transpeptidase YcbB